LRKEGEGPIGGKKKEKKEGMEVEVKLSDIEEGFRKIQDEICQFLVSFGLKGSE
jgi:hypothetical protein